MLISGFGITDASKQAVMCSPYGELRLVSRDEIFDLLELGWVERVPFPAHFWKTKENSNVRFDGSQVD